MNAHDILHREKIKFQTYPISGVLAILMLLLTIYHVLIGV